MALPIVPRLRWFGIVAGGLVLAASVWLLMAQGGSSDPLQGISAARLAEAGLTIKDPGGAAPAVTADQARDLALSGEPGASVREVVLVRLLSDRQVPPIDALAWAINFDPKSLPVEVGGPFHPGRQIPQGLENQYSVAFVNAATGKYLFTVSLTTQTQ